MRFNLHKPYKPTGDQPGAIEQISQWITQGNHSQTLLGVTGSGKTFSMANIINNLQRPALIISHNKTLAAQLATEFQSFFPNNAVHYFVSYYDYYQPEAYIPQSDTYIEKETQVNEEIDRLRHASTQSLLSRNDVIIVASVSCIYGLGSPQEYKKQAITVTQGQCIPRNDILRHLTQLQFTRNDTDFHRGTFRVRGDSIEIYPVFSLDEIIRIELFGDTIEQIHILDSLTGKQKIKNIHTIDIYPATHYVAPEENRKNILATIERDMLEQVSMFTGQNKLLEAQRIEQRTRYDLEMIKNIGYCNGIENYSRYFDGREQGTPPYTLLDYFPKNFLLMIDESHMTIPQIGGMYHGDKSRKDMLINYGFRLPAARDNRPLTFKEFESKIHQTLYVSATPGPYEIGKSTDMNVDEVKTIGLSKIMKNSQLPGVSYQLSNLPAKPKTEHWHIAQQLIRPTYLLDPTIEMRPTKNQIDDILAEVQKRVKKQQRVLITTLTKRLAEELNDYLQECGIQSQYLHSEVATLERIEILRDLRKGTYDVLVGINLLREGLDLPEVSLVIILDADKEGFLRSETSLIQTMGRAARHIDGRVIMYADIVTGSMKRAINETNRRRTIQKTYNKKHGITPLSIQKAIKEDQFSRTQDKKQSASRRTKNRFQDIPKDEIPHLLKELEAQMELAAQNLEFEKATKLRDSITELKDTKQS
ncbi:MAG: UvrABC system protein B [Parcubacteria group bacterium GW2011_GWA2_43_13]|nr:MAG: UvrABC system protein B [Parcubacteria group bacterium GW2011_GWA2_43_13]OGY68599.1 MAG: excinuclease ABC subunit B [Candidatus Jacksonbacteria bacterium RIFCSPHIGHO2_02_FULL_43_10]OGY71385.1 MAG: excinuclease ABC subunit B [Candidatus Jacksonbacteria bacterium RIFCSPLOWO2_01_FULL_44_13]HAZ16518.1 excinuclease ABC subunit B [Candidatus Jacksonbacteria bacterium]